jgi:hypothetical protein
MKSKNIFFGVTMQYRDLKHAAYEHPEKWQKCKFWSNLSYTVLRAFLVNCGPIEFFLINCGPLSIFLECGSRSIWVWDPWCTIFKNFPLLNYSKKEREILRWKFLSHLRMPTVLHYRLMNYLTRTKKVYSFHDLP